MLDTAEEDNLIEDILIGELANSAAKSFNLFSTKCLEFNRKCRENKNIKFAQERQQRQAHLITKVTQNVTYSAHEEQDRQDKVQRVRENLLKKIEEEKKNKYNQDRSRLGGELKSSKESSQEDDTSGPFSLFAKDFKEYAKKKIKGTISDEKLAKLTKEKWKELSNQKKLSYVKRHKFMQKIKEKRQENNSKIVEDETQKDALDNNQSKQESKQNENQSMANNQNSECNANQNEEKKQFSNSNIDWLPVPLQQSGDIVADESLVDENEDAEVEAKNEEMEDQPVVLNNDKIVVEEQDQVKQEGDQE